jgi:hypothetical protein
LYHANWCGHCTVFVPKWEQLPSIDDIGRYIQIAQHEDATITNPEERAKVSGFPTILIRVGSDEYNYTGSREVDDILRFVRDKLEIALSKSPTANTIEPPDNNVIPSTMWNNNIIPSTTRNNNSIPSTTRNNNVIRSTAQTSTHRRSRHKIRAPPRYLF